MFYTQGAFFGRSAYPPRRSHSLAFGSIMLSPFDGRSLHIVKLPATRCFGSGQTQLSVLSYPVLSIVRPWLMLSTMSSVSPYG